MFTGGIDIAAMKEDMGEQDKADKFDEKQKRRDAKRVQSKIVVFVVTNGRVAVADKRSVYCDHECFYCSATI